MLVRAFKRRLELLMHLREGSCALLEWLVLDELQP